MKTKKLLKAIVTTVAIAATIVIIGTGESSAALQANQNTQYTKKETPTNWMKYFREMETTGGAMGLSETLKTDLTASSSSNNIDIHMMKTTEYGAIAILSASGYGNPSNEKAITTTTGNDTGIILSTTAGWEWTAGGLSDSIFSGTNARYYDAYTSSNASAKIGDALGTSSTTNPGCAGWHSASIYGWVYSSYPYFKRGDGGIFSFSNGSASGSGSYCRGVAVCGTGF